MHVALRSNAEGAGDDSERVEFLEPLACVLRMQAPDLREDIFENALVILSVALPIVLTVLDPHDDLL